MTTTHSSIVSLISRNAWGTAKPAWLCLMLTLFAMVAVAVIIVKFNVIGIVVTVDSIARGT